MDGLLETDFGLNVDYFFQLVSLLVALTALIYAALAFRVAKQALNSAKDSDLATLKLRAYDGRAKVQRSFFSLQSACQGIRQQWQFHHDHHHPPFGFQDHRLNDTRHIAEIESEGRSLLVQLALGLAELEAMDAVALEEYIKRTDETALSIEQLTLRLTPPKKIIA